VYARTASSRRWTAFTVGEFYAIAAGGQIVFT
jgi:hypothetical protein